MIEKPTFEAMPQIMARLEEKVDALTETVGKLLQGAMAPMVVTAPEEMVTVKDAASILRLSVSRVYALVQEGRIPCYKPGRNLLFLPSELRKWMAEGLRKGQPSIEEQMEQMTKGMRNSAKDRRFI
ncbi:MULTISPECIES: helix-turn-helix domain-containing protein [Muribaculaceae]|jgi:excisionase family DNA binding protein|uniref:helix-turn-helix domain-containing protein n=2 Tax=Bacteroidales TaxID=171549 RepID=UPI0014422511|nr:MULTISPECIES: helix-turn-helix domain-containing protein [Muribaculaceae]